MKTTATPEQLDRAITRVTANHSGACNNCLMAVVLQEALNDHAATVLLSSAQGGGKVFRMNEAACKLRRLFDSIWYFKDGRGRGQGVAADEWEVSQLRRMLPMEVEFIEVPH